MIEIIKTDIPSSQSYFKYKWSPSWPDIINKYDSKRMKKRKMKRWPKDHENLYFYEWFTVDGSGIDYGEEIAK